MWASGKGRVTSVRRGDGGAMDSIRFATIGRSGITERFLEALAETDDVEYVGAYSRDEKSARDFGSRYGARLFFDDLAVLAASDEVDAVYIATPNGLHASQAMTLARAGKHVMVEKAFSSCEREAAEVFSVAHDQGVVAMEAMRNLHVPSFDRIREALPRLGPVRLATFRFSKVTSRMARLRQGERLNVFDPRFSEGALMDIGVYCVEPAVALFGRPARVLSAAVTTHVPGCSAGDPYGTIDLAGEALLDYGDKVVNLSYGKMSDDMVSSQIEGEEATIVWDQTSCPVNVRIFVHEDKGMVYRMSSGEGEPIFADVPEKDMVCEIATFAAAIRGDEAAVGKVATLERTTLDSLHVMDEIRSQTGVRFPADDAL